VPFLKNAANPNAILQDCGKDTFTNWLNFRIVTPKNRSNQRCTLLGNNAMQRIFWRFKELKERNIFPNRMAARRAVLRGDIEPPVELSPNVIAWTDDAVAAYLRARPRRVPPAPGTGKIFGEKASVREARNTP